MQTLNGFNLISYSPIKNQVTFVLDGVTLTDALSLNGSTLTVSDEETDIAIFDGYTIVSLEISEVDSNQVIVRASRKLDERIDEAISGLDANVTLLNAKMDKTEEIVNDTKKFAYEHGMPSYVETVVTIYAAKVTDINDEEAMSIANLFPEYEVGVDYKKDHIIRYNGDLYRIGQDHTSQEQWVPGADGTTALYSKIDISEDGYETWQAWDGVSGAYAKDRVVRDPTDEQLYKSLIDNNVWGPPSEQPNYWERYEA